MKRPARAAARVLAAVASVLLLSGCYAADLDAEVSEAGKLTGTLFVGVAISSPEGNGEHDGEPIFNEDTTKAMFPGAIVTETISEDGYLGQQVTFTDAPLDYFNTQSIQNALGTRLSIERDGTEFVVDGTQDLSFLSPSQGDDIPDPRVELTLTFPGEVAESNGEIDGRTVTWTNPTEMTARAGATALFPYQLVGAAVGGVVLLGAGVWFLASRRKRANDPTTDEPARDTKPSKTKKLPNRKTPKPAPRRAPVVVAARPVTPPPADWWLDTPDTSAAVAPPAPIDPVRPVGAQAQTPAQAAVRDLDRDDLEQITSSVDGAVHALYATPAKKRRNR